MDEAATKATKHRKQPSGPVSTAKLGYKSKVSYSHYSTVRTIEAEWNLLTLTSYDASATPMTEFFESPLSSSTGVSGAGRAVPV